MQQVYEEIGEKKAMRKGEKGDVEMKKLTEV